METRKHIAAEKKRCNSHNCAQAILHTYADVVGISEQEAMDIAGAFGGAWETWKVHVAHWWVLALFLDLSIKTR